MKKNRAIRDIAYIGIASAALFVTKEFIPRPPNVELVSLFIILYTLHLKQLTLYVIYIFVAVEGVLYGFGMWWFSYLYIWTILYFLVKAFSKMESAIGWSILSGSFGLFFGLLTAIPYLFTSGMGGMIGYFLSGIPFDLIHCGGNFIIMLLLYKPLNYALEKIIKSPTQA
ncbi:MAG: hypothetical protein ACOX3W_02675 [Christensenellaceae bacterium]|jgi:energy-coupling factor transport system substrate-specific component